MYGLPPSPESDASRVALTPVAASRPTASYSSSAWATPGDRQAAARDAYRASVAEGVALTGKALGRMFDRSPRWGVDRVSEVRTGDIAQPKSLVGDGARRPPGNGNGSALLPIGTDVLTRESRSTGRSRRDATNDTLPIGSNGRNRSRPAPAATASRTHSTASAPSAASSAAASEVITPAVRRITTSAVVAVALVAAIASYDHQRLLAELAGEGWRAWLLPLSVDGLVVAASMSMLIRRRTGQRAGALAWVALVLGVGVSVTANVAAAEPTLVGRLVAGWPPVALLLAFEICLGVGGRQSQAVRGGDRR